jgi:predicted alpha/beta superfamily hydrolase
MLRATPIHVHYPLEKGQIVLRTDADWDRDILPTTVDDGYSTFEITSDTAFVYFKPCLRREADFNWSVGANYLLLLDTDVEQSVYPRFFSSDRGSFSNLIEVASRYYDQTHKVRVFLPPGYQENTLKNYPVLYMHDGNNLFFPQEASFGETWEVAANLDVLDSLRTVREVIVVGVWPVDRMAEYTKPAYADYGKFLVEELKPFIDRKYRTLPDRQNCAVMGSSLGGVVSFYLGWEYPQVFGMAACMSSTFGFKDDLRQRVANEPRRPAKIYLDSGAPGDNYEVSKDMYELLRRQGYVPGQDVLYFAFPEDLHNEKYWSLRSHLPYQYFFERE